MEIKKFNQLNESFDVDGLPEPIISFFEYLDIDPKELKKMTYKIANTLHRNATGVGVFYDDENIVFTSESSYKNWLYYAGYEYIDGMPVMIHLDGDFYAVYNENDDERIAEDIDRLLEIDEE
jgi:hypothetical protein